METLFRKSLTTLSRLKKNYFGMNCLLIIFSENSILIDTYDSANKRFQRFLRSTTVTRSSWYSVTESNEFILHAIKTQNAKLLKYLLKDHAWNGWHVVREHYLKLDDL